MIQLSFAQWVQQTSGTTEMLNSVHFCNDNVGCTVGWDGTILKTTNGGTNWSAQTSGTTQELNSVFLIDANSQFFFERKG